MGRIPDDREMLQQGISLLNKYYYDNMQNGFKNGVISNQELQMFLKIIECFSGVYGFYPTMEPYIPDEMRQLFVRRANELEERHFREFASEIRSRNQAREREYTQWDRANPRRNPDLLSDRYPGHTPLETQ